MARYVIFTESVLLRGIGNASGPSGAGKTTVVNLLGRLYDSQQGAVAIDGVNLREYQIASRRRRIAIVTQDVTLFNIDRGRLAQSIGGKQQSLPCDGQRPAAGAGAGPIAVMRRH